MSLFAGRRRRDAVEPHRPIWVVEPVLEGLRMVVSVIVIRSERSNALPISLFHDTVLDTLFQAKSWRPCCLKEQSGDEQRKSHDELCEVLEL
jgi:hypothetical protein